MSRLVQDLLKPANYPPPRPTSVKLVTTHGSWVFLTDTDAWKVKRPVDYGFFDFTTLEKRRIDCEAEVTLNRRLSRDTYLGVLPVRRDAKGHSVARGGEIVDYAVRMKRLNDDDSALAWVRDGRPLQTRLEGLAELIANFHRSNPGKVEFASPEALAVNVKENFSQLQPFLGQGLHEAVFRSVKGWQETFLEEQAFLLRDRAWNGYIAEGHGDLRLEHWFISGSNLIDCIEFNERFRHLDGAADIAFLAMDLEVHGHPEMASWLLSQYAEKRDDYRMYRLLDFYFSYRAWVRGKIALFQSEEAGLAKVKLAEAEAYFNVAEAYTRRRGRGLPVIAVGGMIGSGKSTLAEAVAYCLSLPLLVTDRLRKRIQGREMHRPAETGTYKEAARRATYAQMLWRAGLILESNRGAVLDATFWTQDLRLAARDLARYHKRPFLFLETHCDEETIRERLRKREYQEEASDASEDLLDRFKKWYEPATGIERRVVRTTGDLRRAVQEIGAQLGLAARCDTYWWPSSPA